MNIKLKAKLSAYSKVDSIGSEFPRPLPSDYGKLLGVGRDGSYELFGTTTAADMDELFEDDNKKKKSVNELLIDSMFK